MPVLDRWRTCAGRPEYLRPLTPEVRVLADRIFGAVAEPDAPPAALAA